MPQATVPELMAAAMASHGARPADTAALAMVSGGSDSTALAYAATTLRDEGQLGALAMLHVNHQLRGAEADEDAAFVAELAHVLGVPLFSCEVDVAGEARRSGENVEAVGRRERYVAASEALRSLCEHEDFPLSAGRILTAHTADDRVESFYMRSIVGTGPGGFRAMRYENGSVLRPLLDCTRAELRAYVEQRAVSGAPAVRDASGALWREDATNAHTDRFRAFVRHSLVPVALEWNPQLLSVLPRTMNLIADEDDMLEAMADELVAHSVSWLGACEGAAAAGPGAAAPEVEEGFLCQPAFGREPLPLQRRAVRGLLARLLGEAARVEAASVEAVLAGFLPGGAPRSGYVANIQGNLAVSANKRGVRVEPMARFRARRKRDRR